MIFQELYDAVKERRFVVIDTKTGKLVEEGFLYDKTNWSGWVNGQDTEAFDTLIDKFLLQRPSRYMIVRKATFGLHGIIVGTTKVGSRDYVAGFTKGQGKSTMVSVTGEEIFLREDR